MSDSAKTAGTGIGGCCLGCLIGVILMVGGPLVAYRYYQDGALDKGGSAKPLANGPCAAIPEPYKEIFTKAGAKFSVQPAVIAAIFVGEHSSIQSSDYKTWPNAQGPWAQSSAKATGPFQFLPQYYAAHAQDGDGDGDKDINDLWDSAFAAAHKMAGLGMGGNSVDEHKLMDAASAYNSGAPWHKPRASDGRWGQNFPETRRYVVELVLPAFRAFYCTPISGTSSAKPGTGNDGVPLFLQCDSKWAQTIYGIPGHTICSSGCCPTSAAMVLRYYGINVDPVIVADFSYRRKHYQGSGTITRKLIPDLKDFYKLAHGEVISVSPSSKNWESVLKLLEQKKPIIASGIGSPPFSDGGHCIVLTGYDRATNQVRVNNPSGRLGNGPFPLSVIQKGAHTVYYLGK